MQSALTPDRRFGPICLGFLIVVLLAMGLFFRFANLDKKVYRHDETRTSLRISGSWAGEMKRQIFDGREISIQDVQKYQRVNPERGFFYTIFSLAADDPKHPPLYYALVRLWAQLLGDSVGTIRALSSLISLLVFPCFYWLCRELFRSDRTAWMVMVLMAVSPFHVLYAQEAREYSLWTVSILLASVALLRALRLRARFSWRVYAAAAAVGLYSHTLFGLVVVGHAMYVIGTCWQRSEWKELRFPKLVA